MHPQDPAQPSQQNGGDRADQLQLLFRREFDKLRKELLSDLPLQQLSAKHGAWKNASSKWNEASMRVTPREGRPRTHPKTWPG